LLLDEYDTGKLLILDQKAHQSGYAADFLAIIEPTSLISRSLKEVE